MKTKVQTEKTVVRLPIRNTGEILFVMKSGWFFKYFRGRWTQLSTKQAWLVFNANVVKSKPYLGRREVIDRARPFFPQLKDFSE